MSILRVKHDKKNPYVMINREALWDKDLSLQAIGLWARLLSRPDDWKIYVSELAQSCGLCNADHKQDNQRADTSWICSASTKEKS